MKTRLDVQDGLLTQTTVYYNAPQLNTSQTDIQPSCYREAFTVLADSKTGNFRETHAHSFTKAIKRAYQGTAFTQTDSYRYDAYGYIRNYNEPKVMPESDFNTLYNTATSRVYDQIRADTDLSIDAFQVRQTARMVKGVSNLVDFVRSFKPRNWGNKWLEYQYGWRPLVNTIYDSARNLIYRPTYDFQRITGKANMSDSGNLRLDFGSNQIEEVRWSDSQRVKIVCEFALKNSAVQRLANFTSLNPVSIAWELVPYSFVVDWVYDVGGYLRNLENAFLYSNEFKRGYLVQQRQWITNATLSGVFFTNGYSYGKDAKAYSIYRSKDRSSLSLLVPRPPQFKVKLGWERALSGASLLAQHLGR